jgi:hypothetical protein
MVWPTIGDSLQIAGTYMMEMVKLFLGGSLSGSLCGKDQDAFWVDAQ